MGILFGIFKTESDIIKSKSSDDEKNPNEPGQGKNCNTTNKTANMREKSKFLRKPQFNHFILIPLVIFFNVFLDLNSPGISSNGIISL